MEREQQVQQNYYWRKRTMKNIKIYKSQYKKKKSQSQIILESRKNNVLLMNISPLDSVKI